MTFAPLVEIRVDFNTVAAGGLVKASRRFVRVAWYDIDPGILVRLVDGDDNSCLGTVEQVHGQSLKVRPAFETWTNRSPALVVTSDSATTAFGAVGNVATPLAVGAPQQPMTPVTA